MHETETQVVKIQLGDSKQATSYVYTLAEKIQPSDTELFVICELPLFNPAAVSECQRIAEALAATLKRLYKKPTQQGGFESALALVNEELGKLASMGKSHWVGKLNAAIAVKKDNTLSIAAVGKISAQMFRDGEFASIIEPSTPGHALKTFENFSEGKLRLGDMLVLSSTQLFNHISVDRVKSILAESPLTEAAQEIIDTLNDVMGPEAACGTILVLQAQKEDDVDETIDLQNYLGTPTIKTLEKKPSFKDRVRAMGSLGGAVTKNILSDAKSKLGNRKAIAQTFRNKVAGLGTMHEQLRGAARVVQPSYIKGLTRGRKIFLISAAVLLIAIIANLLIATRYRDNNTKVELASVSISELEKLANDANAALLYGDETQATNLLAQLQSKLNTPSAIADDQKAAYEKVKQQAEELSKKIDKVTVVNTETLGALGNADRLISIPGYLATETGRTIISYNLANGEVKDDALRTSEPISSSSYLKNNTAAIYNGSELMLWDFKTGILGGAYTNQVPSRDNAVGPKVYSSNNRAYMIDRSKRQILGFPATDSAYSEPSVSLSDAPELSTASDFAIDGNIYIVSSGEITKYNSGKKQDFNQQLRNVSKTAKLYTKVDYKYLYVLDGENRRIGILDKQGAVVKILSSEQFKDMKDFVVDEKDNTIYILSGTSLIKARY